MFTISRRQSFQLALAAALAATTAPALAQSPAQKVTVALDWTPNTNHIGLFVARDRGFYAEAGLDVAILPYGDTGAGTLVSNGVADFGVAGNIGLFTQRTAGADLKAVYAVVQSETGRLVFNGNRNDIKSPRDLDGKIYGGFGSNWEKSLLQAIIRHDGGKGMFETVTLGTSAYEALANGAVDFTLEVSTWEGVKAALEGVSQKTFRYADYGVPDEHTTFLVSSDAYLSAHADTATKFAQATQRGYAFAVDHPDEATALLLAANKGMLTDEALIKASLKALVDGHYLRTADGVVGTINPAKVEAIGTFLFSAGILKDANGAVLTKAPAFTDYYTNALLQTK